MQRLATDAGPVHRPGPQADPKFAALKADVRGKQKLLAAHPPAKSEAAKAQGAAKPPQDDKEAQGKAANAEKMNAAKPGEFDKAAFIRAVNEAIAAQAPKNLDEADKFGDSGKADAVKGQVQGQVTDGKKASANAIETTTKAPPDTSKAVDKPVTPLVADKPPATPGTPGTPDPAKAVPDKAPPAATDLSGGPKQVDQQMAEAQVTEEQLAKSNEPEFTGALKEKNAAEQHAATAPGQVRAAEAQTLAGAKAAAGQAGAAAMTALTADRKKAGAQVGAGKEEAKSADEAKRAKVTAILQKVFDATKKDVEGILSGLDKKVDDQFSAGEKAARDAFTAEHKRRMDEYKDKRYSGLLGKGRWLKDKFAGLPEEANQIFVTARKGYVDRMQQVISGVADTIGAELGRAKQRIATGRNELQAEVKKLPADLQAIGKEAAGEFSGKFDELTEQVNNKGTELVQTLASKYNEALKSVDEEIAAEKEKNKGLVAKAVDAVAGVIKTIMQLKDMLMGVLAKAAHAVMAIIKDPIGFLGKLVSAVGAGLRAFMANIGEHLKKGLVGWLTGAMAGAGLELPAKFDLRGIVMMIGSLLGLTWAAIRGRIVKRGVPEQAMGAVEQSVPVVQKVQAQGLGGMWEEIKEKVGDLKANLFSKISEYLIPTILMAGITWIISLLNPASAFIRAVKMIIDFVTFIVTQGAQIIEFVNSVLDAIIAIAGGGPGGVPALVEKALARSVPVLIGVLAAVLGIGGLAQKVQKFFKALAKPVMKAVDWVVGKIVGLGKKLWAKLKAKSTSLRNRAGGRRGRDEAQTERSARVRAGVAADLRGHLGAKASPRHIKDATATVWNKWRSQGLKELHVVSSDPNASRFGFFVRASAKTKVVEVDCDLSKDPRANEQDHFQPQQPFRIPVDVALDKNIATRAQANLSWPARLNKLATLQSAVLRSGDRFWLTNEDGSRELVPRRTLGTWVKKGKIEKESISEKGAHAEVAVLERLKGNWGSLPQAQEFKEALQYDPICWLALHITRSPCLPCADSILSMTDFARDKSWTMKTKVSALSLYHSEGTDSSEAKSALAKLAGRGVQLSVMPMSDKDKKKLVASDPELARQIGRKQLNLSQAIEDAKKTAEKRYTD
ncbi:hypothetical protein [Micromonospora eburnea]|uniref:APOBEC-like N-terminal domain-containing protein n=1 Tax=Micromonospora eburnea TaxID=227316 RepID=A0A1C6UK71_9ACTN|nr:hypothetical protein GA0070604_2984 [Micromonospora eburnea]